MKHGTRSNVGAYMQPAFLICTVLLGLSGIGMSVVIKTFEIYLKKEPVALKKPLHLLDEERLVPYKVISKEKITNKELLKGLGTEDYIQWRLEDTEAAADSNVRYCMLFVTYYGVPDKVPHVPEHCYTASGYQKLRSEDLVLAVDKDGVEKKVPARYIIFTRGGSDGWNSGAELPVLYLFNVNGEYVGNRNDVRVVLNKNLFGKYSYFSKIEWWFYNNVSGIGMQFSEQAESMAASSRFLSIVLPVLEKEHWPDWQ